MAKGSQFIDAWDLWVANLRRARSIFRMVRKKGKKFIYVKELSGGKTIRSFSSASYKPESDDDIAALGKLCIESSRSGRWLAATKKELTSTDGGLSWNELADRTRANLRARIAREGSRKNAEGHLTEIAKLSGQVYAKALERWALERDPIAEPSAFRNRIETLSHIDKAGDIDLKNTITGLKAHRPTGAAKKENDRRTQKIRAIPTDESLERWLDRLTGETQWTLAMIAAYGLRPSEAWHVSEIDADGWATIPGEGITKTDTHFARPVPAHWPDRYQLRERLPVCQQQLQARWPVRWEDRNGLMIPLNNSKVSNALYQELEHERIPRLYVGEEWLRPYDLRHAYAIRCETSDETLAIPSEEFARYLGHGFEVHKRIYLRHMSPDRQKAAMKARARGNGSKPSTESELPADVLEQLAQLAQIKKTMGLS